MIVAVNVHSYIGVRRKIDFKSRSVIAISNSITMIGLTGVDYIQGHVKALSKVSQDA